MKILRTPQGAYFQQTDSGAVAVSDPRTIEQLRSGQLPFDNVTNTNEMTFASAPVSRAMDFSSGNQAAMPSPEPAPTGNPLEIFNSNIQGLLKLYQNAPTSEEAYKELYNTKQKAASQGFMPMDPSLIGGSPEDLMRVRNTGVAMWEPEQNAIAAKIKADEERTDRFLKLVEVAKDFGVEYAKAMPMDDTTAKSMLSLLGSGKEFDGEMVKSLLSSPYAKNNPEEVNSRLLEYSKNKNKVSTSGGALTTYQKATLKNSLASQARQDPAIKVYNDVRGAYEQGRAAYEKGAKGAAPGIGDIVLMRTLAKITDPTSSVREEEFKTFESAQAALGKLGIQLTKQMWTGQRLTTTGRNQLYSMLQDIYDQRTAAYNNSYNFFNSQAVEAGLEPDSLIPHYEAPSSTSGSSLEAQVAAKGYDYQSMKADGNSDEEIRKALGL